MLNRLQSGRIDPSQDDFYLTAQTEEAPLIRCVWTVSLQHRGGTEQQREGGRGERARRLGSADTGNGNRCKSGPGDMT